MELYTLVVLSVTIVLISALGALYLYCETKEMERSQEYYILREQWRHKNDEKDKKEI